VLVKVSLYRSTPLRGRRSLPSAWPPPPLACAWLALGLRFPSVPIRIVIADPGATRSFLGLLCLNPTADRQARSRFPAIQEGRSVTRAAAAAVLSIWHQPLRPFLLFIRHIPSSLTTFSHVKLSRYGPTTDQDRSYGRCGVREVLPCPTEALHYKWKLGSNSRTSARIEPASQHGHSRLDTSPSSWRQHQ
jgi:hypothetical protein